MKRILQIIGLTIVLTLLAERFVIARVNQIDSKIEVRSNEKAQVVQEYSKHERNHVKVQKSVTEASEKHIKPEGTKAERAKAKQIEKAREKNWKQIVEKRNEVEETDLIIIQTDPPEDIDMHFGEVLV